MRPFTYSLILSLAFSIFSALNAHAVKPNARTPLAQSIVNQRNIYSFPYQTPLEKIGAEELFEIAPLRFMSDTVENEFAVRKLPQFPTVQALAQALKNDPSLINSLPPILIWQDTWGRVFTLDHRRLLAARIAGISKMKIRWATPAEFREDQFKFTTTSLGKSIHLIDDQGKVIQTLYSGFISSADETLFDHALEFALKAHGNQPYGTILPYAYHLAAVVSVLRRFGYNDIQSLVAALLHDTIEDTKTTYQDIKRAFGAEIADIVFAVTNATENESGQKLCKKEVWRYTFPKILATPGATLVKLADRIANTEESIWGPMRGRDGKLDAYRAKYAEFEKTLRKPGEFEELWNYLKRLTNDPEFAKRQVPSQHQRACEVTLVNL